MNDIMYDSTTDLKSTLVLIKTKLDEILSIKQSTANEQDIVEKYKKDLVPLLLCIRKLSRLEIMTIEDRNDKIKEINQKLINLQQTFECLEYEVACLGSKVELDIKDCNKPLDGIVNSDHDERMKSLEEEERKRRDLQTKLAQLEEDTKKIEVLCDESASHVDHIKPYIKQLLDKVGPTLSRVDENQDER